MQKLIEGIHHFQETIFDSHKHLFRQLKQGQQPLALFITCSDSRIDPNLLTQAKPGELFIMRNAGNIVPPYSTIFGGEAATIEYAVATLKVRDIIVCGHSLCGAMDALLRRDQLDGLNAVKGWLKHAETTARIINENYQHIQDDAARLTATVEENVLVQLENLRSHPCVADAVSRGDLNLHGWTYKFETGEVFSYDPHRGQFQPIEKVAAQPSADTEAMPAI
ncbi:MAG: Carbonic anhydrase [Verrucomicrobia subdivision 3 bacterium]|nr:Carbonic anhydrase [Limisphaerales bacterium]MCS1413884.1 Carbonic anhydrase [Limisphaerales bacterium]